MRTGRRVQDEKHAVPSPGYSRIHNGFGSLGEVQLATMKIRNDIFLRSRPLNAQ